MSFSKVMTTQTQKDFTTCHAWLTSQQENSSMSIVRTKTLTSAIINNIIMIMTVKNLPCMLTSQQEDISMNAISTHKHDL